MPSEHSLTDLSKSHEIDELSWILGNQNSDYKTQLKNSLQATSGKPEGLSYKRLEPEYQFRVNAADINAISKSFMKKPGNFSTAPVDDSHDHLHPKKYDFHKYDKEFKDDRVLNAKGKAVKEAVKEEINVATILSKGGLSKLNQDMTLFNTYQENTKKHTAVIHDSTKAKNYPLTNYLEKFQDSEYGELLSLVNIDYDAHTGMKVSTNPVQQARIKQRAAELEERAMNSIDRRPRLTQEEKSDEKDENSDVDSDSSEGVDDMDIREKRMLLERRRRNLNEQTDTEFQQIATGLHGEPTIINNYAFYENTLLKYEKPAREYLTETEKVLERPTYAFDDANDDYCYRETSPRSGRRNFLERLYGDEVEQKLYEKNQGIITKTKVTEISNNKALRADVLKAFQRDIQISKDKALQKSTFARESVESFFQSYDESFKQCGIVEDQRRQRIKYLWTVVRDFLSTRVFYKKNFRKSAKKDLDAITKIKSSNLLQNLLRGQENLIFQRKDKDKEFVVLNRLMKYQLKLDYILNFDLIMKPSFESVRPTA